MANLIRSPRWPPERDRGCEGGCGRASDRSTTVRIGSSSDDRSDRPGLGAVAWPDARSGLIRCRRVAWPFYKWRRWSGIDRRANEDRTPARQPKPHASPASVGGWVPETARHQPAHLPRARCSRLRRSQSRVPVGHPRYSRAPTASLVYIRYRRPVALFYKRMNASRGCY